MKKSKARIVTVSLLISITLIAAPLAFSGEIPAVGDIGITASMQSEQLDILIPGWLTESIVIAPALGLVSVSDSHKDFTVGVVVRHYMRRAQAMPYIGVRGLLLRFSPEDGEAATDFLFGALTGGEFLFHPQFSIGVEAQLNVVISHEQSFRFGNPDGTNINTGSALFGTFYF